MQLYVIVASLLKLCSSSVSHYEHHPRRSARKQGIQTFSTRKSIEMQAILPQFKKMTKKKGLLTG